ncbi:unnamed protein product [Prorocentrum cordatum]|uniref:Uncharacterized protein n=1 Tax=Prorocentrum cordatum TaxID=2364126 RepID=A0ABN9TQH0_9DINO|nr:unnamed protein product [Polarella glacialis]
MAKARFLLLVAASLLGVGASAPQGRLAWGGKAHRRLSGDDGPPVTDECLGVCPGLSDMVAAYNAFAEPESEYQAQEMIMDLYCDHESAVQCFVDELSTCSNSSGAEGFIMMASKLKCICDTCPGGKTAWAKLMYSMESSDEDSGSGMVGTTTLADGTGTTGADDGNFDKESLCPFYTFVLCADEYATDCGAILEEMNVSFSGDAVAMLESECTGDYAPGADDDDDDDDNTGDVVGSCGPFGLGWIAASLAPVMAALECVAA